jgi:hypothetical protein
VSAHWAAFLDAVPWFRGDASRVAADAASPGTWSSPSRFRATFPRLDALLGAAHVTRLAIDGHEHSLFAWPNRRGTSAWLSPEPSRPASGAAWSEHRLLLESFGGVVERAHEPDSWLLNNAEALTASEAARDASFLTQYSWAFPDGRIPIPTDAYYSIAREANGNTTLCHRHTGAVLLFAPDHAFDHVRPAPGCLDYTLYELPDAPAFRDWVETVAGQWLDAVVDPR